MDITLDHIVALALGRLSAGDAAATRAAVERSPDLQAALDRFQFVARTLGRDGLDPVPTAATDAAKQLGRRLDALRQPSAMERIEGAIRTILARLAFDSRLDGPIVGLRGGTGFVLSFEVDTDDGRADIDLECLPTNDAGTGLIAAGDAFDLVGQATGIDGGSLTAVADDGSGQRFETTIDEHGMFRLRLAAGTYRVRLTPSAAGATPIELPTLELP